jgi:hypothetical protein
MDGHKERARMIAAFVAFGHDIKSDLYRHDARHGLMRRCGSGHRAAFWAGFDGEKRMHAPASWNLWAYEAGKKFRKQAPAWAIAAKTPHLKESPQ